MKTNRLDDRMNTLLALAFVAVGVLAAVDVGHDHYFGRSGEIRLSQAAAQSLHARALHGADQATQAVATRRLAVVAMR